VDYDFIQAHCLSKKGAEEDYQEKWDAIRYTVRGKIFAMVYNDGEGRAAIAVKLPPVESEELRARYSDIVPAYHLNKTHWSAMFLNGNVPGAVLKRMLDVSHELVFNSLSKKAREDIQG
jgi:predicted DNA-binding protein (MmcQ/YjbR family)